jgi:hypothetical protein
VLTATSIALGSAEWALAMDAIIEKIEELDRLVDERSFLLRGLEQ